jgi:transcriptional regulator with XRE-family HTH domain
MTNDERKQLSDKLREAREYLGLSQEEVAGTLGIARAAISQIEHGNRRVDAIELAKLARLYQRPVSHFTGSDTVEEPPQIALLKRAASALSDKDREEVLRFAEFLRGRATSDKKQ